MLVFEQVQKYYGTKKIIEIPSLQLDKGIYWIKGENGSGKTTLLKIIAGLLPFKGDMVFDEISIKQQALNYRRKVSWAEAEPVYPEFLSGNDLITLYTRIRKSPLEEAENLATLFGMHNYLSQSIRTYSSGMMKKLSLLLTFLGNPPLIALDEPLITLDAAAVTAVCQLIRERHAQTGNTFLLSSHQVVDAALLPNQTLLMADQQLVTA
jgi:ABC-2 type transport system ATP-binding protein